MQALTILVFIAATLGEFLSTSQKLPGALKLIPEMISTAIAIGVLALGMRRGFGNIPARYWFVFGTLVLIILCGILSSGEGSGPVIAGGRYYLRTMPLFILPAVYTFTDKQLSQQMKVLLVIGLIQVPLACYQRWIVYDAGRFSGDSVFGTLMDSGVLSLVLIGIVMILTGLYLRKRLPLYYFVPLFFFLLLPTTINETKVIVIVLPVALLTALVVASPPGKKLGTFFTGIGLLIAFGAILIPVYDFFAERSPWKQGRNIEEFFTDQRQMEAYMATQKQGAALGMGRDVRRGDALSVPLHYLARDPITLAFGLGMGNVTHSNLGESFTGNYNSLFDRFLITSATVFLLEIGLFGITLIFALYWFIFLDALALTKLDPAVTGLMGAVAAGWVGIAAIMPMATFYSPIHSYASISYLFWYFSGLVVARRTQLASVSTGLVTARDNQQRLAT